jgi:hypothetical protein
MRKYIDIISEFQKMDVEKLLGTDGGDHPPLAPEDDGGWESGKTVVIHDIVWDLDDEEIEALGLPSRAVTTVDEVNDAADPYADEDVRDDPMHMIGNWLTSTYHGNLSNFDFTIRQ